MLTVTSLILTHLILQSQLRYRQADRFYVQVRTNFQEERELRALEETKVSKAEYDDFIADHLEFGCQTGAWVYKNETSSLSSTVLKPAP